MSTFIRQKTDREVKYSIKVKKQGKNKEMQQLENYALSAGGLAGRYTANSPVRRMFPMLFLAMLTRDIFLHH